MKTVFVVTTKINFNYYGKSLTSVLGVYSNYSAATIAGQTWQKTHESKYHYYYFEVDECEVNE